MQDSEMEVNDFQENSSLPIAIDKNQSNLELFTNHKKINLLNYLFDFLLYEDVLRFSSLNSHVYNHIKNKKCTDKLRIIKTKFLSKLITTANNFLGMFISRCRNILDEVDVDFKIIYEYLALYSKKYIFKHKFSITDDVLSITNIISNILQYTQFEFNKQEFFILELQCPYSESKPYNWEINFDLFFKILFMNSSLIRCLGELNLSNNKLNDEFLLIILPLLSNKNKVL